MQSHCGGNAGAPIRLPARRTAVSGVSKLLAGLGLCLLLLVAGGDRAAAGPQTMVVRDDPGGSLEDRLRTLAGLRRQGTQVQIRGGYCMSACTMYLGLDNICISPNTVFGFHGPSSPLYGIALPPEKFEYWSHVMAAHYPAQLRGWYLREGRRIIVGFHEIPGHELIRMGVPRCT